MVSQELHYSALTLQFPRWPPNSPKISQAGDLGVVADSIHVNLKHTHFSLVSLAPADALFFTGEASHLNNAWFHDGSQFTLIKGAFPCI